jgi:hypothetical protein
LDYLPAKSEPHRVASVHTKMRQQRDAILSELSHRVTVFRLPGPARAAAIENKRSKPLREKRHNADVPGIGRPPRRGHEQNRLAAALFFVVHLNIAKLCYRHTLFSLTFERGRDESRPYFREFFGFLLFPQRFERLERFEQLERAVLLF